MNAIIAGVIGLISGALGSLIAPWIHWGIEKKRKKYERRIEQIQRWREILSKEDFDRRDILNDPSYGPLRELLTIAALKEIERPGNHMIVMVDCATNSPDRDILLREVARIEKEWKLI